MSNPIGILGGSGLYHMEGLRVLRRVERGTPFGLPSGPLVHGELEGRPVVFLARHGEGHVFTPSEIPYRANLWAMKDAGVEHLVSVSAVGSLQPRHKPGELRLIRQYIDRTKLRRDTFFGEGVVAHVSFAEPTCPCLTQRLLECGKALELPVEDGATYVCMEGPAFSTKAESRLHQSWGADLIGMTQLTEAKLARELELCFAGIAMVTDYDAWHEEEAAVDVAAVMAVMKANGERVERLLHAVVKSLQAPLPACACRSALQGAAMTSRERVPAEAEERLGDLLRRCGY